MSSSRHHDIRAAVASAIVALTLTACPGSNPPPSPQATASSTERPREGGTLRVALVADPDSLDPHRAVTPPSWIFARALHRGLFAYPAAPAPVGAEPVADLASAMPNVSDDGRRVTVTLRSGVRFGGAGDGPIEAADVEASMRRLRAAGVGIAASLSVVSSVAAHGPRTIVFTLARPAPNLPWLLAHPQAAIVPRATPPAPADPARIGAAGPYRVATYRPEARIELARNDAWRRADDPVRGAWVDRIDATVGMTPRRAELLVRSGRADLVIDPGPPDVQPRVPDDALVARAATTCVRYLFLNTEVAPFDDRLVRLAVAHAVDRDAVAAIERTGAAVRLLAPGMTGHSTEPVLAEDVRAARRALRSSGRRSVSATLVVGATERDRAEARAVRTSLGRAGIAVRIRTVPAASLYPLEYEVPQAAVPMGIATWCADWPGLAGESALAIVDPRRGARLVYSHLRSARVVAALEDAARAALPQAAAAWRRAEATALRTAAVIPLSWPAERVVVPERVRGWTGTAMFPRGDPAAVWLGAGGGA